MMTRFSLFFLVAFAMAGQQTVTVVTRPGGRQARLPGDLDPYLRVELRARVPGYLETLTVDRGSAVKRGQTIAKLSAPEMQSRIAEAEARVRAAESQKAEAQAKMLAAESTYDRLKAASATPGVIAGNELILAEKAVEAARALILSLGVAAEAAKASVAPLRELESYLEVKAPFDGIVVERHAHPGALAGPDLPLVTIEQQARLRLVVAVPEADAAGIPRGGAVQFRVAAYPGRTFSGTIARVPNSVDKSTRTMPVEVDVDNSGGALAPGMYAEVDWPVRRSSAVLLVPPTAVANNTERAFVIRVTQGKAEWVDVVKGTAQGDLVEVRGALAPGDVVLARASDELRPGTPITMNKQ